jgi:hypothetical protein
MGYDLNFIYKAFNFNKKDVADFLNMHRESLVQAISNKRGLSVERTAALMDLELLAIRSEQEAIGMAGVAEKEKSTELQALASRKMELEVQIKKLQEKKIEMARSYSTSLQQLNNILYVLAHSTDINAIQRSWFEARGNNIREILSRNGTDQQLIVELKIKSTLFELKEIEVLSQTYLV